MRGTNIALDLYSCTICLLLILYLVFSKMKKDRQLYFFIFICACNILLTLGDITNWAFEGFSRPWYPAALLLGSTLYYLCTGPMLLFYVGYVISFLSVKIHVPKCYWRVTAALCAFQITGSIMSVWNGMFFTIGAGNTYRRGDWFWLSQIIPFIICLLATVLILRYRKYMRTKDMFFLLSYVFFPLIAEIIQIPNYGIALLNNSITLSILLIFINLQAKRELLLQYQEKELSEAHIHIMMSQIKPHFLYNTLSSIRYLCDENPNEAKEALLDFSIFLRANMNSLSNQSTVPFTQELTHTKSYLRIEQRRFQSRLSIVYQIETVQFEIPPLTLQPIVENAVRHGVLSREKGGKVTIRTEETGTAYVVTVIDNGIGFQPMREPPRGVHIGIENVRSRLFALCKGSLEIRSTIGVGTAVVMSIPKKGVKR